MPLSHDVWRTVCAKETKHASSYESRWGFLLDHYKQVAESQDKFDETNTREGRPRLRRRTSYSEHFPQTLPSLQSTANLSSTLGSTAGSTSRETLKLPPIGPRRNTGMHSTSSSAVGYTGGQPLDRWAKHARGRVDAETSLGWPRGAHAGFSKIAD